MSDYYSTQPTREVSEWIERRSHVLPFLRISYAVLRNWIERQFVHPCDGSPVHHEVIRYDPPSGMPGPSLEVVVEVAPEGNRIIAMRQV